ERAHAIKTERQRDEGEEGKDSAFSFVLRSEHDPDVLHRHDEHERPEDQRRDSENILDVDTYGMPPVETFLERIKNRSSDVAEDDSESGHGERDGAFKIFWFCVAHKFTVGFRVLRRVVRAKEGFGDYPRRAAWRSTSRTDVRVAGHASRRAVSRRG